MITPKEFMIVPKYFSFNTKKMKEIYNKYMVVRILPYSILTDTDSICVFFIFICKPERSPEMFCLKLSLTKIFYIDFDTSHKFWEKYSVRNESLRKKLGYFLIENIDDPCIVSVAVNPKEYFEQFESQVVNKIHKVLRKGAVGMEFEDFAKRINSIKEMEILDSYQRKNKNKIGLQLKQSNGAWRNGKIKICSNKW